MASSVGIPSVPSGLPRDLSRFLQTLAENVRILAGSARGADAARAVRHYERTGLGAGMTSLESGAVANDHLKPRCVTADKLGDYAVTERALGMNAVTGRAIKPGSVTQACLAEGVLPPRLLMLQGSAVDGERVRFAGAFGWPPVVCVTAIHALAEARNDAARAEPLLLAGPVGLMEVIEEDGTRTGQWEFTAAGTFAWAALGYAL